MRTKHEGLQAHQKALIRVAHYGIPDRLVQDVPAEGMTIEVEHIAIDIGEDDAGDAIASITPGLGALMTPFTRVTIYSGLKIVFAYMGPRDPELLGQVPYTSWVAPAYR